MLPDFSSAATMPKPTPPSSYRFELPGEGNLMSKGHLGLVVKFPGERMDLYPGTTMWELLRSIIKTLEEEEEAILRRKSSGRKRGYRMSL